MRYAPLAFLRRRLLLPVLALGGLLLLGGCARFTSWFHYVRGTRYLIDNKYEEADKELREAIRVNPGFVEAHEWLAHSLFFQLKYGEAEKEYREVDRLKPNDDDTHLSLAVMLEAQGKYEEAERELKEVIRLAPNSGKGYWGLGFSLDRRARRKEARPFWESALKTEKDPALLKYIKKRLAEPD